MGVSGIVECFMTSERKRKLRYTHYIGGGDSKKLIVKLLKVILKMVKLLKN